MVTAIEADDADLVFATDLNAVGTGQFDGAFRGFRAGGEQKCLVEAGRGNGMDEFNEFCAFGAGKDVVVEEFFVDLSANGIADFWGGMA